MKYALLFRFPLAAIIMLAIAGCTASRIVISVLEPAEISIPPEIRKVSLFPGAGIPNQPGDFDSLSQISLNPAYDYNRIKRGYMEALYEVLMESPRFSRVVMSDTQNMALITSGKIGWDDLSEICRHDSTEAIFLLKKAVTRDYTLPQSCGAVFVFINHTKWALYEPFRKSIIQEIVYADTASFNIADQFCGTDISYADMAGVLYDAVFGTGSKMGKRVCPIWNDNVPRILISGPESEMHQAAAFAANNRWDEAAAIWNRLADEGDRNLASHASFNLALAWEQGDDLDQAWSWITYSDSLKSTSKSSHYKQLLAERMKQREILNQQLSGE